MAMLMVAIRHNVLSQVDELGDVEIGEIILGLICLFARHPFHCLIHIVTLHLEGWIIGHRISKYGR